MAYPIGTMQQAGMKLGFSSLVYWVAQQAWLISARWSFVFMALDICQSILGDCWVILLRVVIGRERQPEWGELAIES